MGDTGFLDFTELIEGLDRILGWRPTIPEDCPIDTDQQVKALLDTGMKVSEVAEVSHLSRYQVYRIQNRLAPRRRSDISTEQ
jgi:DNA invertase Pin-like site-specific DNA recombinase